MELIVVIFAAAALLWGLICAQRCSLLVGCTAFILLGYVFTRDFWSLRLGPLPLTLDRLLITALMMLFCWRWRRGKLNLWPLTGADWLGLLFVAYLTIRCLITEPPGVVASSVPPFWRLIASFWMSASLLIIARNSELCLKHWKQLLAGLTLLGVYLALTGIAEVKQQWWAVFPRFISDPSLGTHFGRARGPALMSASLGVYLTICFWAAWFLWAQVGRWWRLVLGSAMLLMCLALYYTYTRSCWMGLAGGLAIIPLFHLPKSWRPAIVAGLILVLGLGGLFVGGKIINLGRKDSDGDAGHSVYQRASFVYVSLRMLEDSPLFGCGFGRFYDKKMPYLSDRSQKLELESLRQLDHHNTFLSLLTETGVIGIVLFLALLAAWCRSSWALTRDPNSPSWMRNHGLFSLAVLITYVTNALFHDLTLSPSEQWILCLVAGVTCGLDCMRRSQIVHGTTSPKVKSSSYRFMELAT